MICPECGEVFGENKEYISHLLEVEGLTLPEIYSRIVTIGLLTKKDINNYFQEDI